ncbi:MAG: glycoside hydrolase family 43 protein [Oceanospirillaceae bacterium]|nr:glycoside hydrolase family 43 protein [Oceanospirillaceae bacterium]
MKTISNPILTGFHPDPSICRCGDDYYIATSTFEWFPGVRVFHSRDLIHWRLVSRPLNLVSLLDMKGNPDSGGIWAPCLSYADGKFWLLYTDVKAVNTPWKNGRNYLITATDITGPWSEPIAMGNGGFDPSLFHDSDGRKYYLYRKWGPKHHSNPYNDIILQEFFPEHNKLSLKREKLFSGTQRKLTEGAHIYQRAGYYYLVLAEGGTIYQHTVTVARSKALLGPYELHPDETIVTTEYTPKNVLQKAGHASFVHTHTDEWYMAYIVARPIVVDEKEVTASHRGYCPLGRETALDKIVWRDNWPYAEGGQHAKQQVDAPNMALHPWPSNENFIDEFDSKNLDAQWQTLRIPFDQEIGQLIPQQSLLRLYGKDSLISLFTQATVARRWQGFNFEASTKLSFMPRNDQQTAGLTCYYNSLNWSYCFIDYDEALACRTIKLTVVDKGEASYYLDQQPIIIPETVANIWMKTTVSTLTYGYSYSFDGNQWHDINISLDAWKLSDDYILGKGFFTGAFVGMHCEDMSADGCYADFHHFTYCPMPNDLDKIS